MDELKKLIREQQKDDKSRHVSGHYKSRTYDSAVLDDILEDSGLKYDSYHGAVREDA